MHRHLKIKFPIEQNISLKSKQSYSNNAHVYCSLVRAIKHYLAIGYTAFRAFVYAEHPVSQEILAYLDPDAFTVDGA